MMTVIFRDICNLPLPHLKEVSGRAWATRGHWAMCAESSFCQGPAIEQERHPEIRCEVGVKVLWKVVRITGHGRMV